MFLLFHCNELIIVIIDLRNFVGQILMDRRLDQRIIKVEQLVDVNVQSNHRDNNG